MQTACRLAPDISEPSLTSLWAGTQARAPSPLLLTTAFIFASSPCDPHPGTAMLGTLASVGQPGLWPQEQVVGGACGATPLPSAPHSASPLLTAQRCPSCLQEGPDGSASLCAPFLSAASPSPNRTPLLLPLFSLCGSASPALLSPLSHWCPVASASNSCEQLGALASAQCPPLTQARSCGLYSFTV